VIGRRKFFAICGYNASELDIMRANPARLIGHSFVFKFLFFTGIGTSGRDPLPVSDRVSVFLSRFKRQVSCPVGNSDCFHFLDAVC
jgi:hypothetical protein